MAEPPPVGLLLAAGSGRRFGGDKLLAPLPGGPPIAVAAARALCGALPRVVAVVRPDADRLAAALEGEGVTLVRTADCRRGMGASLAHAASEVEPGAGCLVALADKPYLQGPTVAAVRSALVGHPGRIVIPAYAGSRGHPVGFGPDFLPELRRLDGDAGGRVVVRRHPEAVFELALDDPGVVADVDHPRDLRPAAPG